MGLPPLLVELEGRLRASAVAQTRPPYPGTVERLEHSRHKKQCIGLGWLWLARPHRH